MPHQPTPESTWVRIRTSYIIKGWTAARCAQEFGLHVSTVKNRAAKEGWRLERDRTASQIQEKVAEDIMAAVEPDLDEIRSHTKLSSALVSAITAGVQALNATEFKSARDRAEILRIYAGAGHIAVRLSREVHGLSSGESSDNIDSGGLLIEEQIVEPVKLPLDEKGRAVR